MTTASLLRFCSDSYQAHPMISGHLSREKTCHCRESQASTDEVWKTSNKTDKIQHSPFCTETSVLVLANSAFLFSRKSKWLWWILEMNIPEQRVFFFFVIVSVLSMFWTERVRAQTSVSQALRCHELQVVVSDGGSAECPLPSTGWK